MRYGRLIIVSALVVAAAGAAYVASSGKPSSVPAQLTELVTISNGWQPAIDCTTDRCAMVYTEFAAVQGYFNVVFVRCANTDCSEKSQVPIHTSTNKPQFLDIDCQSYFRCAVGIIEEPAPGFENSVARMYFFNCLDAGCGQRNFVERSIGPLFVLSPSWKKGTKGNRIDSIDMDCDANSVCYFAYTAAGQLYGRFSVIRCLNQTCDTLNMFFPNGSYLRPSISCYASNECIGTVRDTINVNTSGIYSCSALQCAPIANIDKFILYNTGTNTYSSIGVVSGFEKVHCSSRNVCTFSFGDGRFAGRFATDEDLNAIPTNLGCKRNQCIVLEGISQAMEDFECQGASCNILFGTATPPSGGGVWQPKVNGCSLFAGCRSGYGLGYALTGIQLNATYPYKVDADLWGNYVAYVTGGNIKLQKFPALASSSSSSGAPKIIFPPLASSAASSQNPAPPPAVSSVAAESSSSSAEPPSSAEMGQSSASSEEAPAQQSSEMAPSSAPGSSAAASSVEALSVSSSSDPFEGLLCRFDGMACTTGSQCCSGNCAQNVCASPPAVSSAASSSSAATSVTPDSGSLSRSSVQASSVAPAPSPSSASSVATSGSAVSSSSAATISSQPQSSSAASQTSSSQTTSSSSSSSSTASTLVRLAASSNDGVPASVASVPASSAASSSSSIAVTPAQAGSSSSVVTVVALIGSSSSRPAALSSAPTATAPASSQAISSAAVVIRTSSRSSSSSSDQPLVLRAPSQTSSAVRPSAPPIIGGSSSRVSAVSETIPAQPRCGNGVREGSEECDRGSENSNFPGVLCRPNCTLSRCGDFVRDPAEQCDDGNLTTGDGCDASCAVERPAPQTLPASIFELPFMQQLPVAQQQNAPAVAAWQTTAQPIYDRPAASVPATTNTGPETILVTAAGAAAGYAWIRRRRSNGN